MPRALNWSGPTKNEKSSLLFNRESIIIEPGAITMVYSKSLAARVRQALAQRKSVVERKMFGGIAFLLDGNMLVGVWNDSLIVRLGPEQGGAALSQPDVRPFDVTTRPMKGWVIVEPDGIDSDHQLRDWIERAVTFVRTLPAK